MMREAVSLKVGVHQIERLIRRLIKGDDRRQTAVRTDIFHEKELIVQRSFRIARRIHVSAHGLRFKPDTIIIGPFPQYFFICKNS